MPDGPRRNERILEQLQTLIKSNLSLELHCGGSFFPFFKTCIFTEKHDFTKLVYCFRLLCVGIRLFIQGKIIHCIVDLKRLSVKQDHSHRKEPRPVTTGECAGRKRKKTEGIAVLHENSAK